jgi:4-hydroxy-3-polyprenylbenzoate decarboxylase
MGYQSLREAVDDLETVGELVRLRAPISARLEMAEVQRRVFAAGGPAVFFERVEGSDFPAVSNLFGTKKRCHYLFRDALDGVRALVAAKVDPASLAFAPALAARIPGAALHLLPRYVGRGAVEERVTRIGALPQVFSWPDDGGPFITLPQVYSEDPEAPGYAKSNVGMYRVQLAGNEYVQDAEIGLHYQIHRGIGVHHAKAIARGEPLKVRVFVGGPPAFTLAAVMPLPEGLPEFAFAGAMNRRAARLVRKKDGPLVHADADFCISGWIDPSRTKPEGPFGDHLGYYALTHEFPVLHVTGVTARKDAIWPFTVVGRPPQEDTLFGDLIHELTASLVPNVLPGVRGVNAVDAAGVHPLLLALGSERYVPYRPSDVPMELLTQASAILGQGQMSLAKYLVIAAEGDAPPPLHDVRGYLLHALARIDLRRDLHFITNTSIDTLDYSGSGFNRGSKLVIASRGPVRRTLQTDLPSDFWLPPGCTAARVVAPGIVAIQAPTFAAGEGVAQAEALASQFVGTQVSGFPCIVLCDDAEFTGRTFDNFLWVTFTRSNPAIDVHGVGARTEHKAWGCDALVIDARRKPHHAPPLVEDPTVTAKVDRLFQAGGPLAKWG